LSAADTVFQHNYTFHQYSLIFVSKQMSDVIKRSEIWLLVKVTVKWLIH